MPCLSCGSEKVIARGLCLACYHRQRRRGTVARKNTRNLGLICSASGCDQPASSKGLCSTHYQRQAHPLKNTWKLLRGRYIGEFPIGWQEFDAFLADVGERPSPKHQLRRVDETKPYGATNIRWVKPVPVKRDNMSKESRASYAKEWALQAKYNISGDDFRRLQKEQGGKCAICKSNETLHVDHCHINGNVRGLLCVRCNRGLGYFRDKTELLKRAAAYLARSRQ